jgi:hypothetical protein
VGGRKWDEDILPYLYGRRMRIHGVPKERWMDWEMAKILCEEDRGGGNRNTMCKEKGQWNFTVLILWWQREIIFFHHFV